MNANDVEEPQDSVFTFAYFESNLEGGLADKKDGSHGWISADGGRFLVRFSAVAGGWILPPHNSD